MIATNVVCNPRHARVLWAYIVGPIIGGVLAALNAHLMFGHGTQVEHKTSSGSADAYEHTKK